MPDSDVRLADLLSSLSLVSDLGMGYEPGQAILSCLIACRLARELNLDADNQRDVYYTALLSHVGCTAGAHEQAMLVGGDDVAMRGIGSRVAFGSQREIFTDFMLKMGKDGSMATRARTLARLLVSGERVANETNRATCEVAARMGQRLGLPRTVQKALYEMFERWDGNGIPRELAGEDISFAIRISLVASQAALFFRIGGAGLAVRVISDRAGKAFDPAVADAFIRCGPAVLDEIASSDVWATVLDAEPPPYRVVSAGELDKIARAFADVVDLKSPFTHHHSVEVASLAERASRALGLDSSTTGTIRLAGLFHDLGRVGVPNGIWDKPGPLSVSEWEQVRLHPYQSERILVRSPTLGAVAAIAGMHHERNDGSGYYRQLQASSLSISGQVLAAADAYQAMTQQRPYRQAFSPDEAAHVLTGESNAGRLDAEAVHAVLIAAGQQVGSLHRDRPNGLTEREIEVLRLVAKGLTNREMGGQLSISPKTVGHHIQHIYDKVGVSTRAAAALYAMEHHLLP